MPPRQRSSNQPTPARAGLGAATATPLSPNLRRVLKRCRNAGAVRRLVEFCSWRQTNFVLMIAWLVMIPVSIFTGWIYSLAFISAASIYANVASHLAAWRADVPTDENA